MAMMNEIIYSVPSLLKPFTRKLIVSILDKDIVYFCQMEKLGPSPILRSIAYGLFGICAWFIRNCGSPRLSPYKRAPDAPNKSVSICLSQNMTMTSANVREGYLELWTYPL